MDYWQGLLEYEKKQKEKKIMKNTLNDLVDIALDIMLAIAITTMVLHIIASTFIAYAWNLL
jgi:Na+/glutamate symporter